MAPDAVAAPSLRALLARRDLAQQTIPRRFRRARKIGAAAAQIFLLSALSCSSFTKSNDEDFRMRRVCVSSTPSSNRIVKTISDVIAKISTFFAP